MDITFNCGKCGQSLTIDETGAGQLVDCPKCGTPLEVPSKTKAAILAPPTTPATDLPQEKKCPFCAETIKTEAKVCRFCGRDLVTSNSPVQTVGTASSQKSSPLPKILAALVVITVIVGGGFFAYNNWNNNQLAKAEAARAEAAAEKTKAEAAKVEAGKNAIMAAKRDFIADVFVRTKGGENIKCGLVTILVFDEAAINSSLPGLSKALASAVLSVESRLGVFKTKVESAHSAVELAIQKNKTARTVLKNAIFKMKQSLERNIYDPQDTRFNRDDFLNSLVDEASDGRFHEEGGDTDRIRKAAPMAVRDVTESQKVLDEKHEDLYQASMLWDIEVASVDDAWSQAASTAVLQNLPESIMTAKTDADGRCAGQLPKPGRYAVCADFSRLVGKKSERDTWLIWVRLDDPAPKKIILSNDNTLLIGSSESVIQTVPVPKLPPDRPQ